MRSTFRLLALGAAALFLAGLAAPTPAGAVVPANLDAPSRAIVGKVEQYLKQIKSMQARFLQISSTGNYAQGMLSLRRPGRMRLEYDPPAQVMVIADGTWLIYIDNQVKQVSHVPLSSTPAGILLRNDVSFADPDVTVTAVRQAAAVSEVDVVMSDDPAAGTLTLVFADNPFELRQWRVRDGQGVETTVSLFNARTGVTLDDKQFYYAETPQVGPANR